MWRVMLLILAALVMTSVQPIAAQESANTITSESDDSHIIQSGQWTPQNTVNASGGSYLYSNNSDDALTLNFQGTSVEIIYVTHPSFGDFAIEIDNNIRRTVLTNSEDTTFDNRAVIDYLEDGQHTLRVYPVEGVIGIDAFIAKPTQDHRTEQSAKLIEAAPAVIQQISPSTPTNVNPPKFSWNHDPNATYYHLVVNDPNGTTIIDEWYTPQQANCASACFFTPPVFQFAGIHQWWVQGYSPDGEGPWQTQPMSYEQTNGLTLPGFPTLSQPFGDVFTNKPTFIWSSDVPFVEWYNLRVSSLVPGAPLVVNEWHNHNDICSGDTCTVTLQSPLPSDLYSWTLHTYNILGTNTDTPQLLPFFVKVAPPQIAPILQSPIENTIIAFVQYFSPQWTNVADTTQYQFYLVAPNGSTIISDLYVNQDVACDLDECEYKFDLFPDNGIGTYTWWVQPINEWGAGPSSAAGTFFFDPVPPQAPTLAAPIGAYDDDTPISFRWDADEPNSSWYQLYVADIAGNIIYNQWHQPGSNNTNCVSGYITCTVDVPFVNTPPGDYVWYVQSHNSAGGAWSAPANFTLESGTPTNLAPPTNPINGITITDPHELLLQWNRVGNANAYHVYLNGPDGTARFNQVLATTDLACTPVFCTFTIDPSPLVTTGIHTWWVQPRNNYGGGSWSSPATFNFAPPPPTPATNIDVMNIYEGLTIDISFSHDPNATLFQVYLSDTISGVEIHNQWYSATSLGCSNTTTCSIEDVYLRFPSIDGLFEWVNTSLWIQSYNPAGGAWSTPTVTSFYVYSQNFASQTDFEQNWTVQSGTWELVNGYLTATNTIDGYSSSVNHGSTVRAASSRIWHNCIDCSVGMYFGIPAPLSSDDKTWNSGYALGYDPDDAAAFLLRYDHGVPTLLTYLPIPSNANFVENGHNEIAGYVSGGLVKFYVNGVLVYSVKDNTYGGNRFGFFLSGNGDLSNSFAVDRVQLFDDG